MPGTVADEAIVAAVGRHQQGDVGMAENMVGDTPGQRLPEWRMGIGPHDQHVGVETPGLGQDDITEVAVAMLRLDDLG